MTAKQKKQKIAFFFGAGAEGQGNFDIGVGSNYFMSTVLQDLEPEELQNALKQKFGGENRYFEQTYAYRKRIKVDQSGRLMRNLLVHKAEASVEFLQTYQEELVTLLSQEELDEIRRETDCLDKLAAGNRNEKVLTEFRHALNNEKHVHELSYPILKEILEEAADGTTRFDMNLGISGVLDSKFHTIIDPSKYGPDKFSSVFLYYWKCYFTILQDIIVYLRKHGQRRFDAYYKNGHLNYGKVLEQLQHITRMLYEETLPIDGSYYFYIKEALERQRNCLECSGVITTNYFPFCAAVSDDPIYLNGQLKLFEYPEYLEVTDLTKADRDPKKLIFPFLFGQSLVKPVIHPVQIQAFARANQLLLGEDGADTLVILGFNVNEDDNHINSILHAFLQVGKRIIFVTDNPNCGIDRKLKCKPGSVQLCVVNYRDGQEKIIQQLFAIF